MSGNIKYIGENTNEAKPLPSSGMFKRSNSVGKNEALDKFIKSLKEDGSVGFPYKNRNTKTEMVAAFPILSQISDENDLKKAFNVDQTPADNKDCSVYTISKKTPIESSLENSVSTNPLVSREGLLDNGKEINSLIAENQQLREKNAELETHKNNSTAHLQSQIQDLTRQYEVDTRALVAQHETLTKEQTSTLKKQLEDRYDVQKHVLIHDLTLRLETQSKEHKDELLQQVLNTTNEIQKKGNAFEAQIRQLNDLKSLLEQMVSNLLDELEKNEVETKPISDIESISAVALNEVETKPISDIESMSAVALIVDSIIDDTKENKFEEGPVSTLDLSPNIKPFLNTTTPSSNIISKEQPPDAFLKLSQKLNELYQMNEELKKVTENIANNKRTESRTTMEHVPSTKSTHTVETQTENAPIPKDTSTIPKKTAAVATIAAVTQKAATQKAATQQNKTSYRNTLKQEFMRKDEKYMLAFANHVASKDTVFDRSVKNEINNTSELKKKYELAVEAWLKLSHTPPPVFSGGKSRRCGKRFKSRKPRALKNKTKTRKYRKRSFTRRRK